MGLAVSTNNRIQRRIHAPFRPASSAKRMTAGGLYWFIQNHRADATIDIKRMRSFDHTFGIKFDFPRHFRGSRRGCDCVRILCRWFAQGQQIDTSLENLFASGQQTLHASQEI